VKRSLERVRTAIVWALLLPLRAYQRVISPALPRRCKYEPTCSAYAAQALRELGPLRGTLVAAWRLARCNPLSHGGYDPLEARKLFPPEPPPADGREAAA
jgi:putative membrane protein insertion efficiency factor